MEDSPASCGQGRAAEALSRTFSNSPDNYHIPLRAMPSLQPHSNPLYSPDTRVFNTPDVQREGRQHGGLFPVGRAAGNGQHAQGFLDHMDQYAQEQLSKEWDGLYLGDAGDDLRSGTDVYRALRGDLRALACAMKQSFSLLVDSRQYSGAAGRSGGHELDSCINELKTAAKDMASATRMATDNYNLQVELTLQKHASHQILALLNEAQLARMAAEEELNALRAEGQRAVATEAQVSHLRRLNDALQAEAQQASGELMEMRRRARELEDRLEAQRLHAANLSARLREMELFEDSGSLTPVGDLCGSSDGGSFEGLGLAAVAAALGGAAAAAAGHGQHPGGEQHAGGPSGALAAGRAGPMDAAGAGVEGSAVAGGRQVHTRDLPPELRRLLLKVLRRRDAEAAKLREENAVLAEELARLRASAAAAPGDHHPPSLQHQHQQAAVAAAPAGAAASPSLWRMSGDSWHTDDDMDGVTRPLTADQVRQQHHQQRQRAQRHSHQGATSQQHHQHQSEMEVGDEQGQHAHHAREQELRERLERQGQDYEARLQAAQEAVARLEGELAQVRAELQAAQQQREEDGARGASVAAAAEAAQAAAEAEAAAFRCRLAEVEAQAVQQQQAAQQALERLAGERDALETALREAREAATEASAAAATAATASAATAAASSQTSDQLAAELASARQLVASLEAQLAAGAAAQADLQARVREAEQRERAARETASKEAKEHENTRKKLSRLQTDMRELRAEAQVARGEATAASRDVKAANSEKLKAQGEMEEALERLRQAEAARGVLAAQLEEVERERGRLEERLAQALEATSRDAGQHPDTSSAGAAAVKPDSTADATAAAAAAAEMSAALETARVELAAVQERLAEQQRGSREEQERWGSQLAALQSELGAARQEVEAVRSAAQGRVAELEAQLLAAAAAARSAAEEERDAEQQRQQHREQHQREEGAEHLERLQRCLAEATGRVAELEAQVAGLLQAQKVAAERAAQQGQRGEREREEAVAVAQAEARRRIEEELAAAAAARRDLEARHEAELERLRVRVAELQAAVAAAASPASPSTSNSSSDAGMSGGAGSPAGAAAASAAQHDTGLEPLELSGDEGDMDSEGDGEDLPAVRARCRVLRGELRLLRRKLGAVVELADPAARERLGEAVARAREAAASGGVASDEEFWESSSEMHSLYALVSALRATALYAGPSVTAAAATYGANRADGAGSLVGPDPAAARALARHRMLSGIRQRCGQVAELLAEAAALHHHHHQQQQQQQQTVAAVQGATMLRSSFAAGVPVPEGCGQREVGSPPRRIPGRASNGGQPGAHAGEGALAGGHCGGQWAGGVQAQVQAVPPPGGRRVSAAGSGVAGAVGSGDVHKPPSYLELDDPMTYCSPGAYARHALGLSEGGGGQSHHPHHHHHHHHGGVLLQPAGASSSFTSETGSSLPDDTDDLAGLSSLYELPPMSTPPKFDLADLDRFTNMAL